MLISLIHEDPLTAQNLVPFRFLVINNSPRLELVYMFIDVLIHFQSELLLKPVTL